MINIQFHKKRGYHVGVQRSYKGRRIVKTFEEAIHELEEQRKLQISEDMSDKSQSSLQEFMSQFENPKNKIMSENLG
jgi:hypothetical protein